MKYIRTPTLYLSALDDPVISDTALDYRPFKTNNNIVLATTKLGGHLGY